MLFPEVIARVRDALARPLPGTDAQLLLAPRPRPTSWRPGEFPDDARRAAAMLLLYPLDERAHLVLTVRTDDLPHHRGQVSLPGGALAPTETIEMAALREVQEELGLLADPLRILGTLTPIHVRVSSFVLYPVVAAVDDRPRFHPATREVARILEVPLSLLADPARLQCEQRVIEGRALSVPFFDVAGERVWGATAMALAELLVLLDYRPDPWTTTSS